MVLGRTPSANMEATVHPSAMQASSAVEEEWPHDPTALAAILENDGRPSLLSHLKTLGVTKLSERQKIANALGRGLRDGTFEHAPAASSSTKSSAPWDFDPYIYNQQLVPIERALAGRARRPKLMGELAATHRILNNPMEPPWPAHCKRTVMAAGCFWGFEKGMWRLPGVYSTAVGFACGHTPHPSYSEVCTGLTGHTEACQVVYDPSLISFADLLRWFWECHDPTQGYGQGADRGTQYRSAIVCYDDEQYQLATSSRNAYQIAIKAAQRLNSDAAITVEILPPQQEAEMPFYYAEEYHMQYLARPEGSPYCTAEPLMISLPPFHTWCPMELRAEHAPRLSEAFWTKHKPRPHCALTSSNEPIDWRAN